MLNLPEINQNLGEALCKNLPGYQKAWFFGKGNQVTMAKRICNGDEDNPPCPVRKACLDDVLAHEYHGDRHGVWGGYSANEREHHFPYSRVRGQEPEGEESPKLCKAGKHEMVGDNILYWASQRRCRECKRATDRRYRASDSVLGVAIA